MLYKMQFAIFPMSRVYKIFYIAALLVFIFSWDYNLGFLFLSYRKLPQRLEAFEDAIHNASLGFGGIVAVSSGPSWRLSGLQEAANLTGIHIDVPEQPRWTTDEVDTFRGLGKAGAARRIGPGQTRCWMGHRYALTHALSRSWDTILVLEDDCDWDIAVKYQMSIVAPHIRQVALSSFPHSLHPSTARQPYGNGWDVLWIGHCGDTIPSTDFRIFEDNTLPSSQKYREYTGSYTLLTAEPHQRVVHKSQTPMCAFAYGITAAAATKILKYTNEGVSDILTTDLRRWCQTEFLSCITVNPELFHHHKKASEANSEIARVEGWDDLAAPATEDFTANIRYSARCNVRASALVSCQDTFDGDRVKGTS